MCEREINGILYLGDVTEAAAPEIGNHDSKIIVSSCFVGVGVECVLVRPVGSNRTSFLVRVEVKVHRKFNSGFCTTLKESNTELY